MRLSEKSARVTPKGAAQSIRAPQRFRLLALTQVCLS